VVRIVLGYIVDDYCLTFVGGGGGSYCSWLCCRRLLLDVCRGVGEVRIFVGYIVDDYCWTFVWGRGGSYCSWLYCGRLLFDVYGEEGATIVLFPFQLTLCFLVFISASA